MSTAAEAILEEALRLPLPDRASLAAELLASLDDADGDVGAVDAWWSAETDRRAGTLDGSADLVTWEHLTDRIADQRRASDHA